MRFVGAIIFLLCGVAGVFGVFERLSGPAAGGLASIGLGLCSVAALGVGVVLLRKARAPAGLGFAGLSVSAYAVLFPDDPAVWQVSAGLAAGTFAILLLVLAEYARRRPGVWNRMGPHLETAFGVRDVDAGREAQRTRPTSAALRAAHLAMLLAGLFALVSVLASVPTRVAAFGIALALVVIGISRESMGWEAAAERRRERRRAVRDDLSAELIAPPRSTEVAVHAPTTPAPVRRSAKRLASGHPMELVSIVVVLVVIFVGLTTSCSAFR